jgi:hypothetical protein
MKPFQFVQTKSLLGKLPAITKITHSPAQACASCNAMQTQGILRTDRGVN